MDKRLKYKDYRFINLLKQHEVNRLLPKKYHDILFYFLTSYEDSLTKNNIALSDKISVIEQFLSCIAKQQKTPYVFEPFHHQILENFIFGKEFIRPLIDFEKSTLQAVENLDLVNRYIQSKENVILLANHQIEADPQVLFLMLEKKYPALGQQIISVAGERVITDPLAVPFSLGCNLFCIYSKKYIDTPPEKQHEKQIHNKRTMTLMSEMLSEGGKCIYVAPSGGRDRKGEDRKVKVANFDPQSIEMLYLMAKKATKKTHFFPLSLATFSILPPPEDVQMELGEKRTTQGGPVHVYFGKEINMEVFPGSDLENRVERRKARAKYIHHMVNEAYMHFPINY
ncbi:MAG: 1-acyl-sn-glycerol-3-phosphate acyltransferase [Chlamydiales bacterium]|nr:1-acyl-sn-glycerol-3-phosphate acyltransferase [Chlamydiales bacterium]